MTGLKIVEMHYLCTFPGHYTPGSAHADCFAANLLLLHFIVERVVCQPFTAVCAVWEGPLHQYLCMQ